MAGCAVFLVYMPQRILTILYIILLIPLYLTAQLPPIGQWRDHLPYHQAIRVVAQTNGPSPQLWCATPYSVFSVDPADKSIERWSKISGLSETGVSTIGLEPDKQQLIIAYSNSNVDVLHNNQVDNIDDIRNSTISGNKTIYHISARNDQALLSTGLGIVVLDLLKYQVKDTWIIGNGGNKVRVNATTTDASFIYAATAEGLKRAPVNSNNLADFRNWQQLSGSNGLPDGAVQSVERWQNMVVVLKDDSLYASTGGAQWQYLYADDWTINNVSLSENNLLLSETNATAGRIITVLPNGTVDKVLQHPGFTRAPQQAVLFQNQYWIADSLVGLSASNGTNYEPFVPNSPQSIATGPMDLRNNVLLVAAGSVNSNWEPTGNQNGLYWYTNDTWENYNAMASDRHKIPDSFPDIMSVAIDPKNMTIWAGSYGGGLFNFPAGLSVYKQNSQIRPAYFTTDSYRVSGLTFDTNENLWIANYGSPGEIVVRKKEGGWAAFTIPFSVADNAVSQIVADDANNQVWVLSPKGNGLFCFNYGPSIDNTADDRWKWYRTGTGNGNLPDNEVLSIALDKSGFLWVGTTRGIGLIQCPHEVFTPTGCDAILPVVQQDNFAGYLFRDEQVQAIAVDGANRKWIATKNGVWLISADAEKTIYRFTEDNSPLVSNNVTNIAINGINGEVFFSTAKGICSFRSTATEGTSTNTNVLVFPNPVPPGYGGTIAIRGVASNSIVKITELDGRLVYQTRALGGQAIWNGKNYTGTTTATGIYLVVIRDDAGNEKNVTKIVFIKK